MEPLSPRRACLLKLNALGVGRPALLLALLERLGPEPLLSGDAQALAGDGGLQPEAARKLAVQLRALDAQAQARQAQATGVSLVFIGEEGYPELLASIDDPPLALYVRGRLAAAPTVAIVGSRRPSPYGRRIAGRLAADCAAAGLCIVSGLARGIDTEAHAAALRAEGTTWAVLGGGLDDLYPPENEGLAARIVACGGAVLSEFPLGRPPWPWNFPRRNRVVAGLCWSTVVIEGRERSGSLITARLAIEQGRRVLAVPGPVDSPLSQAPHRLLADGCELALCARDVVDSLPPRERPATAFSPIKDALGQPDRSGSLSSEHRKILECLGSESRTLEELAGSSGLDFLKLSTIIFELEIQNLIAPAPGQRYAKKGS